LPGAATAASDFIEIAPEESAEGTVVAHFRAVQTKAYGVYTVLICTELL
jgi:hypothetical protein